MASSGKFFNASSEKSDSTSSAVFQGTNYRITVLTERLIRFEYSESGKFYDGKTEVVHNRTFKTPSVKVEQDSKFLVLTTKYFVMQYAKEKPFKGPSYAPDSYLKVKLQNTDKIWYPSHPEARNFKGTAFSIEDYGDATKLSNGLYSTDGFAFFDDSSSLLINNEGYLEPGDAGRVDFYLFCYRRDFGLCLKDYFTLTDYPPLIPRYALGIWWNRDLIYSADDIEKLVHAFNKHDIPLSVLLLSEFWHRKDENNYNLHKSGFTFNENLFKKPKELIDHLHDIGIKIGLNIDGTDGIDRLSDGYEKMCEDLGVTKGEVIPFKVLDRKFIDSYFQNLINPLYDLGVDFFWIDSKDPTTVRVLDYYHFNDYKKYQDKRGMLLSRCGNKASHLYPVHYSGETEVGWRTLKYLPYFNSTASNIGLSWWSHAIGGFKNGVEDSELYLRYVELATFSGIFRFSAKRGAYYKREPWRWDIKTYTIVKDYCNMRHKLIPYLYTEAYKYHKTCLPVIEPLYYYYPELVDEPAYKNEYYFGTELLVCPITKPKDQVIDRSIERIFLPKGIWYDFKTGKKYLGNKRNITFFKDEDYPVYAKEGSIIPLAILGDNINSTASPKGLEIHIFPGASNIYRLYEDDGYSSLYEDDYYIITAIDYSYSSDNYVLRIEPEEGKSGLIPEKRDYKIRFRNTRMPDKVNASVDDEIINGVEYYTDDNDLIVEVKNVDTTKRLLINCSGNNIEIEASRILNEDINEIISDLPVDTKLKEFLAAVIFDPELQINQKRIEVRKLKRVGLPQIYVRIFIKLLEFMEEI